MNDYDLIKQIVKSSGSSFYLPMVFLKKEKKEAMFAVYSFCRIVDDIADDIKDKEQAQKELNNWKDLIENLYNDSALPSEEEGKNGAVIRTLNKYKDKFNLKKEYFDEIIAGMESDIYEVLRPDINSFKLYCYQVASCVGLLSIGVFGGGNINSRIEEFAEELGYALQITNIIRDIEEDALRGRIYIPIEILGNHGADELSPEELVKVEALPEIKAELGEMAEKHFKNAWNLYPSHRNKEFLPAKLMGRIYQGYLTKMQKNQYKTAGCKMSKLEKIKAVM